MNSPASTSHIQSRESTVTAFNGWMVLAIDIVLYIAGVALVAAATKSNSAPAVLSPIVILIVAIIVSCGFFTLQPNEAAVLILFGKYKGTVRESGFFFANPLIKKSKISLRARNLNGEKLKVNDRRGNPIEIAAVVVWRVRDSAQAVFDVDSYESYVKIQSEAAVRHIAGIYAYDNGDSNELTLRGGSSEVSASLTHECRSASARPVCRSRRRASCTWRTRPK